jgi:hypothetical protein
MDHGWAGEPGSGPSPSPPAVAGLWSVTAAGEDIDHRDRDALPYLQRLCKSCAGEGGKQRIGQCGRSRGRELLFHARHLVLLQQRWGVGRGGRLRSPRNKPQKQAPDAVVQPCLASGCVLYVRVHVYITYMCAPWEHVARLEMPGADTADTAGEWVVAWLSGCSKQAAACR